MLEWGQEGMLFVFLIFVRMSGFFVISPLLSNQNVPATTRVGLTLFSSLLIAMVIHKDYLGENSMFDLDKWSIIALILISVKELFVGFVIGFIFAMILDALMFAGQLTGILVGFSMSELIDPVSGTSQTLLSQLFVLTCSIIMLALDYHHVFIRTAAESFYLVPIGTYHFPMEFISDLSQGMSKVFAYGLKYCAFPFVILLLVTIGLGFMAKVMPEMNIFMVGFPMKILIGYYALIFCVGYFPLVLSQSMTEYHNLAWRALKHMGGD